jgi:hypothetical protein
MIENGTHILNHILNYIRVGRVQSYELDGWDLIPGKGKIFLFSVTP